MKIILYSTNECLFSKQEKEYLNAHKLAFEEKNLESNREFLTEMLTVSSNFAGTPVTKIEKDNGEIVVLKGFTEEEFSKTLGIAAPTVQQAPAVVSAPPAPVEPVIPAQPPAPVPVPPAVVQPPVVPVVPEVAPISEPVAPPVPAPVTPAIKSEPTLTGTSTTPNTGSDPLDAILHDLQEKSSASGPAQVAQQSPNGAPITPQAETPAPAAAAPQAAAMPSIPDFKAK